MNQLLGPDGQPLVPMTKDQLDLIETLRQQGLLLTPESTQRVLPAEPQVVAPMTSHQAQGAAEGAVVEDARVELQGQWFKISDSVGLMPLIKFAHTARKGPDSTDLEGLSAMYEMIRDCIAAEEWQRFEDHAIACKAEAEDLFEMVGKVLEILSARPTKRPGDSSAGPQPTSLNSKDSSSTPATEASANGSTTYDPRSKHLAQMEGMVGVNQILGP